MKNRTIKSIVAIVGISFLLIGCSAHSTCDAYSYIQNKTNDQHQNHINQPIESYSENSVG